MNKGCHGNVTQLFLGQSSYWFPDQGDTDEDYFNYIFCIALQNILYIAPDIYEMANYQITPI